MSLPEWKLTVSPEFRADLRQITDYISGWLKEPLAAQNTARRILEAVDGLQTFPLRNARYEKAPFCEMGMRKMAVGNYLLFYFANEAEKTVYVSRLFYAGRDLDSCLQPPEKV